MEKEQFERAAAIERRIELLKNDFRQAHEAREFLNGGACVQSLRFYFDNGCNFSLSTAENLNSVRGMINCEWKSIEQQIARLEDEFKAL